MTFCLHGVVDSPICGPCLVDSIQTGRPSATLYGLLTTIEREVNRASEHSPVSDLSCTIQRLCDVMCYITADISRTYGLRFLFCLRGYISFDCLLKVLNMLTERIELDSDTWTISLLITLCLSLPCKDTGTRQPTEMPTKELLRGLPQYTKMIGVYLDNEYNEMLSGVLLLSYILALRISIALLGDHSLIEGHEEPLHQFHGKLQRCIKLCSETSIADRLMIQGMGHILLCQETIFTIIPLKECGKRKRGASGKYIQGQTGKTDKPSAEPDYKQVLNALTVCFSKCCINAIDFSGLCYTSNSSVLHTVYSSLEPFLSEAHEGFNLLQQIVDQCNVTTLSNLFLVCPLHGYVTKGTILRLLSGIVATHGVQHSGVLFNSTPASLRDAFLTELNTMAKLGLLQSEIATASIVVSGIMSSKTSYSAYATCIDYLNEALKYPLTHGTAELLSLPVIVSRDDFPCFISKIKCDLSDSSKTFICNIRSILIVRHLSGKLKQGRIPSISALVETLITHCSNVFTFDAITWKELNEVIEEVLMLQLAREDWYRLFQFLSPLLHMLFDPETDKESIKDQEVQILKTQMLDNLMKLAAQYWQLKDCPSMGLLASAIESLKLYGRGALNSMDSMLFWIVLSYLVKSKRPFDVVGTVSFILTRIDLLQEESDGATIAQRYLAVLIVVFLGQSRDYQLAETGRNLYSQIWRHLCRIAGQLQSFSCEEEMFLEYSLKHRGLLVQREEGTRQRIQLVCAWFARKKQTRWQIDSSLAIQLCFLDTAQNYRETYPVMDVIFNRYKPEEYLTPLSNLPPIDDKGLCSIVGLSSVSPGFSTAFAGVILCKICYDHLRTVGVMLEIDDNANSLTEIEPSQAALDALERLLKRTNSRQATIGLPGILIVSMQLLAINVSNQSRAIVEAALAKSEEGEFANSENLWLCSALSLLLYINTAHDDLVARTLVFILDEHGSTKSDDDPVSALLIIVYHLSRPITIESACIIGVAMGTLSVHMHRWHHAAPKYVMEYLQDIEDQILHNDAIKAMLDRGFIFFPGETVRRFTKLEDKLSWKDVIRGSNEAGCLVIAKKLLFLVLSKQLYNKSKTETTKDSTVLPPALV